MTSSSPAHPLRAAPSHAATLITVAPTGAESDKAAVPALPVTLDELVGTAKECRAAGAAVIHVHIRDDQAHPTLDLARLKDTVRALRESNGGAVAVADDVLTAAAAELQAIEGVDAAPEGGAALAAAVALRRSGALQAGDQVVVFNTGAGWLYQA